MEPTAIVYLAGLSSNITCALMLIFGLLATLCVFLSITQEGLHKKSFIGAIVVILICTLFPSKATVYTMLVVSDDRVKNIGNDALDIIESKLKELKKSEEK